jgi:NAD+ diphosphatase
MVAWISSTRPLPANLIENQEKKPLMHGSSIYNRYKPAYIPPMSGEKPSRWFIFNQNLLLTRTTETGPDIPDQSVLAFFPELPEDRHFLGELDDEDCYCIAIPGNIPAPEGYSFNNLRALGKEMPEDIFLLAGRAAHILYWDSLSRFCGRCGAPTHLKDDERAKKCDACGNVIYPRISPAIIIAIIKGDQILLAHNKNFRPGLYSCVAGFMEPGEEFEDTARREVFEEVGIQIKNIHYFASQSWPFPDSLMVGFLGEYESGEISVDGIEIESATWFSRGDLPEIPDTVSISGRLIRWFIDHPAPLAALAQWHAGGPLDMPARGYE